MGVGYQLITESAGAALSFADIVAAHPECVALARRFGAPPEQAQTPFQASWYLVGGTGERIVETVCAELGAGWYAETRRGSLREALATAERWGITEAEAAAATAEYAATDAPDAVVSPGYMASGYLEARAFRRTRDVVWQSATDRLWTRLYALTGQGVRVPRPIVPWHGKGVFRRLLPREEDIARVIAAA